MWKENKVKQEGDELLPANIFTPWLSSFLSFIGNPDITCYYSSRRVV